MWLKFENSLQFFMLLISPLYKPHYQHGCLNYIFLHFVSPTMAPRCVSGNEKCCARYYADAYLCM